MQTTRVVRQCDICKVEYINNSAGHMELTVPVRGGGTELHSYADLCRTCVERLFALASNKEPVAKPAGHTEWLRVLSEANHPAAKALVIAQQQNEREPCWLARTRTALHALELAEVRLGMCEGLLRHSYRLETEEVTALLLAVYFLKMDAVTFYADEEVLAAVAGRTLRGTLLPTEAKVTT